MEVTRDVILDLMPLYLADEASKDTRQLVDAYLIDNPTLMELVETAVQLPDDIPPVTLKENEMKMLKKTKKLMQQKNLFFGFALMSSFFLIAFRFNADGIEWFWSNSPQVGWPLLISAALFWIAYGNIHYKLNWGE